MQRNHFAQTIILDEHLASSAESACPYREWLSSLGPSCARRSELTFSRVSEKRLRQVR
jgi:hypothetical protein